MCEPRKNINVKKLFHPPVLWESLFLLKIRWKLKDERSGTDPATPHLHLMNDELRHFVHYQIKSNAWEANSRDYSSLPASAGDGIQSFHCDLEIVYLLSLPSSSFSPLLSFELFALFTRGDPFFRSPQPLQMSVMALVFLQRSLHPFFYHPS